MKKTAKTSTKVADAAEKSVGTALAQSKAAIYLALMNIPEGKVIAYGQLAKLAGLPGNARLAGKVLSGLPNNTELPWHRVINSQGKISLPEGSPGHAEQKRRLEAEGVVVKNNKISLRIYGYNN
ncbi:MGMT family protein [Cellvibrio mixtus]|uniref:MGMT family protein n=1 Tax=Cellvibrio mixtus TaxID=39650 RepID=UPI000A04609E|nr:MGMT family protein [Cellvibrio mixtus]